MIQDILTYIIISASLIMAIRSFIRFFTIRTKMTGIATECNSCNKTCPMSKIMENIEK